MRSFVFFFQAEDGIRDGRVTGVQTCALPISLRAPADQTSGGQSYHFSGWTGDVTSKETSVTVTVDHPMSARATYSSTTILGGVSGTSAGLISVLVVIAVVVALVVWRRSRRRGE